MEEKVRFVLEYEQDECTMRELCEAYDITRETGYVWLRRVPRAGPGRAGGTKPGSAASWEPSPSPAPNPLTEAEEKVSGMRPV